VKNLVNEDKASKYFATNVTPRDRAIFEGGITLGAIYHQVSGFPIPKSPEDVKNLENNIENSFKTQPFIEKISITINKSDTDKNDQYSYGELSGRNFTIDLVSKFNNVRVHFKMDIIDELNYPLMRIIKIED